MWRVNGLPSGAVNMPECRVCNRPDAPREGGLCGSCEKAEARRFSGNYYATRGNRRTVWCQGCGTVKVHPKTEYCYPCKVAMADREANPRPEPTAEQLEKDRRDLFDG